MGDMGEMTLGALLRMYAGVSGKESQPETSQPHTEPVDVGLPTDVLARPEHLQRKLANNTMTLQEAFDLDPEEAARAAEEGVLVEQARRTLPPTEGVE